LDFRTREICLECFDNNAEPTSVVQTAECASLLASVSVYHDGRYMIAAEWLASTNVDEVEVDPQDDIDIAKMRSILESSNRVVASFQPPPVRRRPLGLSNLWGLI
jgi:hypothetical protein